MLVAGVPDAIVEHEQVHRAVLHGPGVKVGRVRAVLAHAAGLFGAAEQQAKGLAAVLSRQLEFVIRVVHRRDGVAGTLVLARTGVARSQEQDKHGS